MRDPYRRASLVVLLLGWVMFTAWRAAGVPWFWGPTPQSPQGGFIDLGTIATAALVANPVGGQPATYTVVGVPAPVGWLILGALLAGAAFALRLSILGVFALAATWLSRSASIGAYSALVARNPNRAYSVVPERFDAYLTWVWAVLALQAVLVAQLAYAAHVERNHAIARGRQPRDGVLDTFHQVSAGAVGRFARPPARPARHTKSRTGTPAK